MPDDSRLDDALHKRQEGRIHYVNGFDHKLEPSTALPTAADLTANGTSIDPSSQIDPTVDSTQKESTSPIASLKRDKHVDAARFADDVFHDAESEQHEHDAHSPLSEDGKKEYKRASKRFSNNASAQRASIGPAEVTEVSGASHQQLPEHLKDQPPETEDDVWQTMPTYATHDIYDDDGKIIAQEFQEDQDVTAVGYLGGARRGYTRVQIDEDAQSATSMDDDTAYLFKKKDEEEMGNDDDENLRDASMQRETTKNLLSDMQKVAYVGVVRLAMDDMIKELHAIERTRGSNKQLDVAKVSMQIWSQKIMIKIYGHIGLNAAEQMMIEQLATHGMNAADLTPTLMVNARVKNPAADNAIGKDSLDANAAKKDAEDDSPRASSQADSEILPPYREHASHEEMPPVKDPSELPTTAKLDIDIRWTVLCDLFLLLIADGQYDARSRTLLEKVGDYLKVPWIDICRFEKRVTDALEMEEEEQKENWDEDEHVKDRAKRAKRRRMMYMGLATVGGGLIIGASAGALAPLIGAGLAAGFTMIGVTGTSGFLAGAGGAAIIGTSFSIAGSSIGMKAANRRTGNVKTFEYRPLHNNKRVNLIVTVGGWMTGKVDDVRLPFSTIDPIMGDIYSIHWEPEMLRSMGDTINILATEALTQTIQQVLGSTILISLMAAMQLPLVLTKLAYLIDNPWSVSLARADAAGLILADSLIDRNLGARPITLVGFSVGARLIYSCLRELAKRGAVGLIQNVYLFGSPVVVNKDEYLRAKSVVAGRFINGYATNDWILGYLFRATSGGIMRVAGLAQVNIPGIENLDITQLVKGHMAYRQAMPRILREVGWAIESDEFTEIEDPDPENFEKRQRELINEIEEARKELEKKPPKKSKWGWFSGKRKEKKEWETYDDSMKAESQDTVQDPAERAHDDGSTVLFDVEAIRREVIELAGRQIDVKQLETTMPPMKIDTSTVNEAGASNVREGRSGNGLRPAPLLRPSKSFDYSPKTLTQPRPGPLGSRSPVDEADLGTRPGEEQISMTFETNPYDNPALASATNDSPRSSPHTKPKTLVSHPPSGSSSRAGSIAPLPRTDSGKFGSVKGPTSMHQSSWAGDEDDEFKADNGDGGMTLSFE